MSEEPNQKPLIISDNDWKEQARKEKEKLAQEKTAKPQAGRLPAASFMVLVNSLVMQSLYSLGRLGDPKGEKASVDLDMAKFHIDTLQMLEDKTKGNLSEEEQQALSMALHEVRMLYVQMCQ